MGIRKLKLTSLLFGDHSHPTTKSPSSPLSPQIIQSPSYSSWAWPSCKHPKTDSLRFDTSVDVLYKTVNSVYFDSTTTTTTTTDSFFTHFSEDYLSDSLSAAANSDNDSESVIRGLVRSERLLFEPGGCTSSILEEASAANINEATTSSNSSRSESNDDEYGVLVPFSKESVVVAMESEDPYNDFRKSMEEMVIAHHHHHRHGDDWAWLEELLVWYLRVNGKKNHGFIVGAFVDLLVGLASNYYNNNNCEGEGKDEDEDENEDEVIINEEGDASCSSNCMSCISYEIEEERSGSSS